MNLRNERTSLLLIVFLFTLVVSSALIAPNTARAKTDSTTIRVPQDYSTIQEAINQANPGDTITVSSGTYHETLFIDKTLTLTGENKANTFIIGSGGDGSVIQVNLTTVAISGFNITGANYGIMLETCTASTIEDNNAKGRTSAIWLYHSNNSKVSGNFVSDSWNGLSFCGHSSENKITGNTMKDNKVGIALSGWNNLIYHNNLVNNENQTEMIYSFSNTWDNPIEGNYWSNYAGNDDNQDGLGDTPYTIDANNQDDHPLMGMVYQFDISKNGQTHPVIAISNTTITSVIYPNAINLQVTSMQPTTGFCRLSLPRALFGNDTAILVNGSPPLEQKELPESNTTHAYLYFTFAVTPQSPALSGIAAPIIALIAVFCFIAGFTLVLKNKWVPLKTWIRGKQATHLDESKP